MSYSLGARMSLTTGRKFVDSYANRQGNCALKHILAVFVAAIFLTPSMMTETPENRAWIPLFDGKDLAGWKVNGAEKWAVEQGTIVGESTTNKYGYLTTEKTYRDFDLRLKFKGEAAGNAGLFLHSQI